MSPENHDLRVDDLVIRMAEIEGRLAKAREYSSFVSGWDTSVWRLIATPIVAYLATGSYYAWVAQIDDPWHKAVGPVIAIMVFTIVMPRIRSMWIKTKAPTHLRR